MAGDDRRGGSQRLLVKLRPGGAALAAASPAALRPLFGARSPFAAAADAEWFVADLPDAAATPWDLAHERVAERLGVAESDVVFVEPDVVHDLYRGRDDVRDPNEIALDEAFSIGSDCSPVPQDACCGKAVGPDTFAWHLGDDFTQLASARGVVTFTAPFTRIAHLDTGYSPSHVTLPHRLRRDLGKNFVPGEPRDDGAGDPGRRVLILDASGHGTGTLGILAGGAVPDEADVVLGGAPDAEIVPIRVAPRVMLMWTSAFAEALAYAIEQGCDVLSMSMGGLPSRAWRETVDRGYERGLCLVTAAGNNVGGFPTRHVVYPARYGRVIAACGVMADGTPYRGITGRMQFEGNAGPERIMTSSIAGYTPNIPWPRFGCDTAVRLNGEGTSAATPQVAAAVALWFEKYKGVLPRDWRRVEAVRHALFESARPAGEERRHLGNGTLRARDALAVRPVLGLPMTPSDRDSFALFRVLTGLGVAEETPRQQMFDLELMQRWLVNADLQAIVEDPGAVTDLPDARLTTLLEALIEDDGASLALRRHVESRYPVLSGGGSPAPRTARSQAVVAAPEPAFTSTPALRDPPHRRLRVFGLDPSFSTRLATARIAEVTLDVAWEDLEPGPVGAYVAVEDVDAAGTRHEGVDLNDARLLARDGWAPAQGNPQFHQQMVYAVAMKTIEHFEHALGRPVQWRARKDPARPRSRERYVGRLTIHPHAMRQANAFYSPRDVALQFGYFEATAADPGHQVPGSRVYTCLSHDIIAHETTHAVLDGMYRRFDESSNPDVLAFHEAFADVVALMQRFTMRGVLAREVERSRGDLEAETILGSLAVQFGRATGRGSALREALGRRVDGAWRRLAPDPTALLERHAPHARGAVLVAAVFDAFVAIYKSRTADLLRIATGGSGVLPEGAIHPDLVARLADEAARAASHVLTMCIRALDYLPPVDVTFFEYLRALITADHDAVRDDRHEYRLAFVEAFRAHGIYPTELPSRAAGAPRSLAVDTLLWEGLDHDALPREIEDQYVAVIDDLKRYADACSYIGDRETLFAATRDGRQSLHRRLREAFDASPAFAVALGLDPTKRFEVHELRRAMRVAPDGRHAPQVIVALTQSTRLRTGPERGAPSIRFRGGTTLVVDLTIPEVRYSIRKSIASQRRRERTLAFTRASLADPLQARLLAQDQREPFAALHLLATHEG